MRVLFLTTAYPTAEAPAAGTFVREHALAVAEHVEVAVVHLDRRHGQGLPRIERVADDELLAWRVTYAHRPLPVSVLAHFVAAAAGYRAAQFEPDILHAHFFLAGVPAVLLGKALRKPVVITEQWSIFLPSDPMPLTTTLRLAAKLAFGLADVVLPPSEALRRAIEEHGIRARFRIVPNVVDTRLFHPNGRRHDGPTRLLAVGLLYEAKGYEFLLEAIALLRGEGRDVRLDILGDGPRRDAYERLVDDLGIRDRVTFRGLQPKEEVARFMRDSDAFVLASRYDNNPAVLIEALASGLPSVATDVGGIPELIDERVGLLARTQDSESLAERIGELLDDLGRYDRRAIADAARERFGREHIGRELADVYGEVAARRGIT